MDKRSWLAPQSVKPLSATLAAALEQSISRSQRLYAQLPREYPGSLKNEFATRWLMLALDHREAFLCLVGLNRRSSAYALMRPIYEAWSRGMWASAIATHERLQGIAQRGAIPKMETIAKELNQHLNGKLSADDQRLRGAFAKGKDAVWDRLSDFAHGGTLHLSRWAEPDGTVAPAHSDDEVLWMLRLVDLWAVVTCSILLRTAGLQTSPALLTILSEVAAEHDSDRIAAGVRAA